jgi:hypothetical protein
MMRRSGQVFRYQTGSQWEMSSDLPCLGGIETSRRRMRPVARSVSRRFSRSRCRAACHFWPDNIQARLAGVLNHALE